MESSREVAELVPLLDVAAALDGADFLSDYGGSACRLPFRGEEHPKMKCDD